jgi:hypothetical protein
MSTLRWRKSTSATTSPNTSGGSDSRGGEARTRRVGEPEGPNLELDVSDGNGHPSAVEPRGLEPRDLKRSERQSCSRVARDGAPASRWVSRANTLRKALLYALLDNFRTPDD